MHIRRDAILTGEQGCDNNHCQSGTTAIPVPGAMEKNISVRMARHLVHKVPNRLLHLLVAEAAVGRTAHTPVNFSGRANRGLANGQDGQPTCVPLSRFAGTCWLFLSAVKSCRASLWFHSTASPALAVL